MAKRTVTSKGIRLRLRKANTKIESLTGEIKGLRQQLLHKEQAIADLHAQLESAHADAAIAADGDFQHDAHAEETPSPSSDSGFEETVSPS